MNPKQEFDDASIGIAKVVRAARERVQLLEGKDPPKEDPDALERAKEDLKDVLEIEEAVAKAHEKLEKRHKKWEEHQAKEAEKAAKEAEKRAEDLAKYGPMPYPARPGVAVMEHKTEHKDHESHHAPVHKK